ncbi:MAG: response regulator transcription factor [Planctomycetota bacterium]
MPLGSVLVVEDDDAIRRGIVDAVEASGYSVLQAPDGQAGLNTALAADLDLVLLDVMMPRLDGLTVLAEIRKVKPGLPVIMLTAKGEEEDKVRGLRTGADDYMVKPFSASELLARVEAVLRRSAERPKTVRRLERNGRVVDFDRRELTLQDGTKTTLPQLEADLLAYLAANPARAVSRDELLQRVWGVDPRGMQTRTVDMAVARLREALRDDAGDPRVISTVRAKGYMLAEERTDEAESAAEPEPAPVGGAG